MEATRFHKQLAKLSSEKRWEGYNVVMNFIRKRLRFTLLKKIFESSRGSRGLRRTFLQRA